VDFDSLRSAVAELERDMGLLEQEIAGPAQSGAARVESILLEIAEESFEEETAAILLTAALHRLDAGIALASSHSRFEEIVSYFPDTAAASAAREQISMIVEGTH